MFSAVDLRLLWVLQHSNPKPKQEEEEEGKGDQQADSRRTEGEAASRISSQPGTDGDLPFCSFSRLPSVCISWSPEHLQDGNQRHMSLFIRLLLKKCYFNYNCENVFGLSTCY